MRIITVREILTATNGTLVQGDPNHTVDGISTDSRTIQPGELFIPLVGRKYDGHDFISSVIEKGVGAIMTHKNYDGWPEGVQVVLVEDTLKALHDLAGYYRRSFEIPVVAVTGSTGKTTTKDMVYSVLSKKFNTLKTQGNLNNEIGLPLTILKMDDTHEIAVVEMGMSGFGEIHRMANIAMPTVGIITNIGVSHIENLGSRENILKAKMEIFDFFKPGYTAILNGDDDLLAGIGDTFPYGTIYFGTGNNAHFVAENIILRGEQGLTYHIRIDNKVYLVELNVPGKHNVYNSLAAIAVGRLFDMDMEDIIEGLKEFRADKMRLYVFTTPSGLKIINDAYNASPDSMKSALATLKDFRGRRKIAVLGDMLELGGYSQAAHRDVGKAVVENGIDILVTKGEDSRWIGVQAREMGMSGDRIFHFDLNKDVTNFLGTFVHRGDTILVKGSRGMKMEEVVEYLREWDEAV